jgi:hypothetical protein
VSGIIAPDLRTSKSLVKKKTQEQKMEEIKDNLKRIK